MTVQTSHAFSCDCPTHFSRWRDFLLFMSSQPASKRKREDDDTGSQASQDSWSTNTTITRSKYWLDDGNVILQAENTQFRVHRSMLSRNSSVFSDMFSIPQPPHMDQGEQLEGCPIIHLSDKASDVEYLISILYDNTRFDFLLNFSKFWQRGLKLNVDVLFCY